MSTNAFQQKRPFKPEEGVMDILKDWPMPDDEHQGDHSSDHQADDLSAQHNARAQVQSPASQYKTNAFYKIKPEPGRPKPKVQEELTVKPLTAEDIEEIRQAAYDDGFAQGKEEGFSQGYAEGREQGYQDGMQQGQAEGKKQGLQEGESLVREQLAQLQGLIEQLQKPLQKVDAQVEQALLTLSLAMAEAVIGVEVKSNPQLILQTLRQAVDALPYQAEKLTIKLHPDDLAVVRSHYTEQDLAERQWQLRAEPAFERGDCTVESAESTVDRSLKLRLQSSLEHFLQEPVQSPSAPTED